MLLYTIDNIDTMEYSHAKHLIKQSYLTGNVIGQILKVYM